MPQLSDDCFSRGEAPLSIAEALAQFRDRVAAVAETETVPLFAADGRVLAEDVIARVPIPPFANSAVDGYAVRYVDVASAGETRLAVVDRLQAGHSARRALKAGEATRIFTGAPIPEGADTVYMQEDVARDGDEVVVPAGLKRGANLRPAGEELPIGRRALPAGRRLRPQDLALAAASGAGTVAVRRRLRIAVFSTGDEIAEPGGALGPAAVYDANRGMIAAWATRLGATVSDLGILRDEPGPLEAALRAAAASHDLLITSGGVSTGEADHVKDAVSRAGRLDVWRFAIKPGRPLALGTVGGAAFVGLPGNPVAVFVTLTQIARGLVAALAGETWVPPTPFAVRSGFAARKKPGRVEFVRVTLVARPDGTVVAERFPVEGAGIVSSLTETDGMVAIAEEVREVAVGDPLAFTPFSAVIG